MALRFRVSRLTPHGGPPRVPADHVLDHRMPAQALAGPLPADQVYYRHFYVPNEVRELRQKLGLPLDAKAAEADPFESGAVPEAGR